MRASSLSATVSRLLIVAALTAGGSGLTGGGPASAAPGSTVDYVALGDSYAAGVGAGPETGACRASDGAYPKLWAALDAAAVSLTSVACSGASSADVRDKQLGSLSAETDLVSITVGSNDLGLVGVLQTCADPKLAKTCTSKLAAVQQALTTTLPADLAKTLTAVTAKAPKAKLAVVGYPLPFADVADCPAIPLSKSMRDAGNLAITGVNRALAAQAAALGVVFVDVTKPYTGRGICSPAPWLVGLEGLAAQTVLHPTLQGQTAGYLSALTSAVGTPAHVLAWIVERDKPAPSPAAGGAGGGGVPIAGPGLVWIVGAGLVLAAAGAFAYRRLRPRRVGSIAE